MNNSQSGDTGVPSVSKQAIDWDREAALERSSIPIARVQWLRDEIVTEHASFHGREFSGVQDGCQCGFCVAVRGLDRFLASEKERVGDTGAPSVPEQKDAFSQFGMIAKGTKCRKCQAENVKYRVWESSDGGHEDYNFRCFTCGHQWWIDGIDS